MSVVQIFVKIIHSFHQWAGQRSWYSNWLWAGQSGDRIPVGARFSAPVQTGPGAHPASCTMGTGSFLGFKSSWGVTMTPHPLLVPWSRKSRAIPLLLLWAVWPVQSQSACTRVHFTFNFTIPLACTECYDSLPFSEASSIPLCYIPFPSTFFHQLVFHPPSLHLAIYFLVYLSASLFPNSYIILFWEFIFFHFLYMPKPT